MIRKSKPSFLKTPRMVLRTLKPLDLDTLFDLHTNPQVVQLLNAVPPTKNQVENWLWQVLEDYRRFPGFGTWAAEEITGKFLGWFALTPKGGKEAELSFRLLPEYWGQGLEAEGGKALLRHAFSYLRLEQVWAETSNLDQASQSIVEALGMKKVAPHVPESVPNTSAADTHSSQFGISKVVWERIRPAKK